MARLIILSGIFKACLTKIQWYNWAGLRLTITISIRQFHILPTTRSHTRATFTSKRKSFLPNRRRILLAVYTHTRLLVHVALLCSGCCGVICYGTRIMWLSRGVSSQGQAKQGNIIEWHTRFELLRRWRLFIRAQFPTSPPCPYTLRLKWG